MRMDLSRPERLLRRRRLRPGAHPAAPARQAIAFPNPRQDLRPRCDPIFRYVVLLSGLRSRDQVPKERVMDERRISGRRGAAHHGCAAPRATGGWWSSFVRGCGHQARARQARLRRHQLQGPPLHRVVAGRGRSHAAQATVDTETARDRKRLVFGHPVFSPELIARTQQVWRRRQSAHSEARRRSTVDPRL